MYVCVEVINIFYLETVRLIYCQPYSLSIYLNKIDTDLSVGPERLKLKCISFFFAFSQSNISKVLHYR